jgi:hypothetical protein
MLMPVGENPLEEFDFEFSSNIAGYFIGGNSFSLDSTRLAIYRSSGNSSSLSGNYSGPGGRSISPWR